MAFGDATHSANRGTGQEGLHCVELGSSMKRNEHAHLTVRDSAHLATEWTPEPTLLTTYQNSTQHYKRSGRTLPAPLKNSGEVRKPHSDLF